MRNKNYGIFFVTGILLSVALTAYTQEFDGLDKRNRDMNMDDILNIIAQDHITFYNNPELPAWTDACGRWSIDDEKWLMRGYDFSNLPTEGRVVPNKIRNKEIMNKYIIDGAFCDIFLRAQCESTLYSKYPYAIYFNVWG